MQGSAWIGLLQSIPPDHHDKLILVTLNNIEINIQGIARMEKEYVVLRGRLAASQESGRLFFVPYNQICYLCFREGMDEARVLALLGPSEAAGKEEAEKARPRDVAPERKPGPAESVPSPAAPGPAAPPAQPAKAALLERLRRSRAAQEAPQPPNP